MIGLVYYVLKDTIYTLARKNVQISTKAVFCNYIRIV